MKPSRKPASGGFGTPELLFLLSVGVLVVVVAFPMLLIFFNAFWVDGHFNVADVVQVLQRKTWSYWSTRYGESFRTPTQAIDGPKCILANEYAGSGGDALPFYFRQQGLGPIIGKRTWGGLVGISRDLPLVDGGSVTMPDFGFYSTDGKWMIENRGVDPDFEVENTPESMVNGQDLQLEKAIQWSLEQLQKNPVKRPARPPYKRQ